MTFEGLERRFNQLRQQWADGQIDQETFTRQVQSLQVQDPQGRYWTIGVQTGKWYYFDGKDWVPGTPPVEGGLGETVPARAPLALPPPQPSRREPAVIGRGSGTPAWMWVGCGGVLALVLAAVLGLLLAFGLGLGPWSPPPPRSGPPPAAAVMPTEALATVALTPTSAPSPTPSFTPTIIPTVPPATETPTVPPSPTLPVATPSPVSSPTVKAAIVGVVDTPAPTRAAAQPEGKIAYAAFDTNNDTYNLYVLNVKTGESRQVVSEASQPSLRRDGVMLAYRSWKSDTRGLWIAGADGENRKRISTFFEDGLPTWSPDGADVIFFSRRESDRRPRLYIVKAAENVSDRGLSIGGGGEYPSYLPDGGLVFRGDIDTHIGLFLGGMEGSNAKLFMDNESDTAPIPSADGSKIAFMANKRDGNWEVYTVNRDGSGLRNLSGDPANDGLPAWSPDGKYVAFVSDRGGKWAIWLVSASGGKAKVLHEMEGPADGTVRGEESPISRGWIEERISWSP